MEHDAFIADVDEFVNRVGARTDLHHRRTRLRAPATLDTLRRAISDEMRRSPLRDHDSLMP